MLDRLSLSVNLVAGMQKAVRSEDYFSFVSRDHILDELVGLLHRRHRLALAFFFEITDDFFVSCRHIGGYANDIPCKGKHTRLAALLGYELIF